MYQNRLNFDLICTTYKLFARDFNVKTKFNRACNSFFNIVLNY